MPDDVRQREVVAGEILIVFKYCAAEQFRIRNGLAKPRHPPTTEADEQVDVAKVVVHRKRSNSIENGIVDAFLLDSHLDDRRWMKSLLCKMQLALPHAVEEGTNGG